MDMSNSNISSDEVAKFDDFASDWWDKNGRMKSLHDINPLRLSYVKSRTQLSGKTVLDVGCGGGLLTEEIARQGAQVTGIDASREMVDIARGHARVSELSIRYLNTGVEDLERLTDHTFDVILCMELLEHVPDPGSVVRACRRMLKPGGIVIFATINRNLLAYWLAIVCAEYILGLLPKGTHSYPSFIKPDELAAICQAAGLEFKDITGFSYNPITRDYYLCRNYWVNYLTCYQSV